MADKISITVPVKDSRDKIRKYLEVLYKFHKLTSRETDVLVEIVLVYIDLKSKYNDEITYKLLFDSDTRKYLIAKLDDMGDPQFQNYLSALRRKKAISKNNKLFPMFIPPLGDFDLVVQFKTKS